MKIKALRVIGNIKARYTCECCGKVAFRFVDTPEYRMQLCIDCADHKVECDYCHNWIEITNAVITLASEISTLEELALCADCDKQGRFSKLIKGVQ